MGITAKILRNEHPWQYLDFLRNYLRGVRISAPPIFIVGCGHSGTSVLLNILDMHPHIHAVPFESRVFLKSRGKIRLAQFFWNKNAIAAGKRRWAEKTPAHIHAIRRILAIYPDARILLIIRDGRDVAISLRKRTGDFAAGVARWVEDNRAGEAFWNHPQVFRLTYEEMVSRFDSVIPRVCEFLGEPYDAAMRDFHQRRLDLFRAGQSIPPPSEAGEHHNQHRNWQINQQLFNGSGKWQREMGAEEKAMFKQQAGQMLIDYGYASDMAW
jgi:hypothetical protein